VRDFPQAHRSPFCLPFSLLLAACSAGRVQSTPLLSPGAVEEPVSAVLTAALAAEARGATADSLWDRDATVVANGVLRPESPRFAGIGAGGEVAITSSRLEVRQSLVWVYLEYRWLSLKDGAARDGKATVLLVPRETGLGWKIVHAHSSTGSRE
jgi:hypothetical protein